jgi:hypothetical protein
MNIRKLGITIVLISSVVLIVNRFNTTFSDFAGKLFCGKSFLQPVNGVLGEASCGFKADMYVALTFTATTILGLILIFVSKKK